jgi:hypothetical protein
MGGHTYSGTWRIDGEMIHVTSSLGSAAREVGGMAQQPEILARIMLRGIVVETGGHPD